MANHNDLGKFGEALAADFLRENGYAILETNWTYQKAEVDIIAQKGNILAIIEVKTRSSIDFGLPQDFVKPKKIQLLVKAVHQYVVSNDLDLEVRFDIIAITSAAHKGIASENSSATFTIEHLKDAFYHF